MSIAAVVFAVGCGLWLWAGLKMAGSIAEVAEVEYEVSKTLP